jgi:hypothetical protein
MTCGGVSLSRLVTNYLFELNIMTRRSPAGSRKKLCRCERWLVLQHEQTNCFCFLLQLLGRLITDGCVLCVFSCTQVRVPFACSFQASLRQHRGRDDVAPIECAPMHAVDRTPRRLRMSSRRLVYYELLPPF